MRPLSVCLLGLAILLSRAGDALPPPPAPASVKPVTDEYFGTPVTDPYRYFEQDGNPQLKSWMQAQAQYARRVLDSLPGRKVLLERVTALDSLRVAVFNVTQRGQRYFYEKRLPGEQLPKLYYRDGLAGVEHVLLDPATLGSSGTHVALDFFTPSWDGHRIAYGLSSGGSEQSVLHVLDVAGTQQFTEAIDRAYNSVVSWLPDNNGFFYMRYPKPTVGMAAADTVYNGLTYQHTLATHPNGEGDALVFGRNVSPTVQVPEGQGTYVLIYPDCPYAIAVANRNMDNAPATLFVARVDSVHGAATPWQRLLGVEDGVGTFTVQGDTLYFLTSKGAPRFRLARTQLAHPDVAHGQALLEEPHAVLTDLAAARDGLYVSEREGAVTHLMRLSPQDGKTTRVPTAFQGTASIAATDAHEQGALFALVGWVQPDGLYHYDPQTGVSRDTGLVPPLALDTSQLQADEVNAVSYDGTRVPLSIIHKKDLPLDGRRPTFLIGYGAYGDSYDPEFVAFFIAWIERGGVLAVAHIRGGGELGEGWHLAGQKQTKLNTIFDFIACGEYLIEQHYTSSHYLAGQGASAGGITVGGALTWRPDLFAVILDDVGMTDTLRVETTPNGPPNIPEFGSVKSEEGFHGLYSMSAYAHVRDGTPYPAVLLQTGANDPRVAPWIVAKMAARLQAATSSGKPVLLDVDYDAGHGMGSQRAQIRQLFTDQMAFALWQFGDPQFQPQ